MKATRFCQKCNSEKHKREFYRRGKDSRRSHCKACESKANHARRQDPDVKKKRAEAAKAYRASEAYKTRLSRKATPREKRRLYMKSRRSGDVSIRIRDGLIRRLTNSIKKAGFTSSKGFEEKLGIPFKDFLERLQTEIPDGYELGDFGEFWDIDHVCPTKQARTVEEAEALQNHRNLRPLLSSENRKKGTKKTDEGAALCLELLGREWDSSLEKRKKHAR